MSPTDIPNAVIAVFALVCFGGLAYTYRLTKASGFLWKAGGFGWIAFSRILLVADVEPFVTYSAQMALPFYVLYGAGLILTIHKLHSVYEHYMPAYRGGVPMAAHAAQMVELAELAATKAAEAASTAAGAAVKAAEAAKVAETIAQQSREAAVGANRSTAEARE